jgi:hypothetical protein
MLMPYSADWPTGGRIRDMVLAGPSTIQFAQAMAAMLGISAIDMRTRRKRPNRRLALLVSVLAGCAMLTSPVESYSSERSARRPDTAQAARSLDATTTGRLHLVRAEGSQLFEEGPVSGAVVGSMRAALTTGAVFSGTFTTRTSAGSISGRGRAAPHGSGRYQSFSGTFVVTGGSGRYARVRGQGGLYGVFDRRSDSVVIQTTGKLSF